MHLAGKSATVIYNQKAGGSHLLPVNTLLNTLEAQNIAPFYTKTPNVGTLDNILTQPKDFVVVVGGDGTLREVLIRLVNKQVPVLIIPLGTANNIAQTLGLKANIPELLSKLANPMVKRIDVGKLSAPWGEEYFIEGIGFGLFAAMLKTYHPVEVNNIPRAVKAFITNIGDYRTYKQELTLDSGQRLRGEYILVEVLNARSVGPRLKFAPGASMSDGKLEVITVNDRGNLLATSVNLYTGDIATLPFVEKRSSSTVSFTWTGFPIHVDEKVIPDIDQKINYWYAKEGRQLQQAKNSSAQTVEVSVLEKNISILLPL